MDTIPQNELRGLRVVLRALAGLSAGVHCALFVYCCFNALQAAPGSPQSFALYHARFAQQPLCAANASAAPGILVLRNDTLRQTWLPQRAALQLNGFVLLAAVFVTSCAAQCYALYTTYRDDALETLRQPYLLRWAEFAATSPVVVALVAMCLMLRDVHTLALLVAAQTACVLVGFPLEYALTTRDLQDPLERTLMARSPPPLAVSSNIICGPVVDDSLMLTQPQKAKRAFAAGFYLSVLLHAAVWGVLLSQLLALQAVAPPAPWLEQLRVVVFAQCVLFSCFALVPLLQWLWIADGEADADSAMLYGSVLYAVLALVAKSVLAATYVTFVQLFPFQTDDILPKT
jgi:hypothetical protein